MSTRKMVEREDPPIDVLIPNGRPRPVTEIYIAAIQDAYRDHNSEWVRIRRDHPSLKNAASTASCLRQGYLRVEPRGGERYVEVEGKKGIVRRWLKMPYIIKDAKAGELDGKFYVWIVVQ